MVSGDGNDGGNLRNVETLEGDEKQSSCMTSLFLEEPAPLKDETFRAPCQLISLVRTVPGWFAITQNAIHFLQNHSEPVSCEIYATVNGECLCNLIRYIGRPM